MTATAHLVAHIAHQRDAAIDTRERLLGTATSSAGVVLATCHRVEIYAVSERVEPRTDMRVLVDADAATHLLRVASGLDSVVAGEPQILTQVRRAYEAADAPHALLRRAFERALHVGREIRRTTRLGDVRRSVGSLAVDEAIRWLADPSSATVLVVGAGEMGKLAVRALARRVGTVMVANRDRAKAEALAQAYGAVACALEDIAPALSAADALISAADTRGEHLTREVLAPRAASRRLVAIDIAVPRSISHDARELDGLTYRSVDDLAAQSDAVPSSDIALAEERCRREASALMDEWRERAASDVIRDVRASADALRRAQLARALRRLRHLEERDRRIVEALSLGVMNSLLHTPTVALRARPSRSHSARELFGLEEPSS